MASPKAIKPLRLGMVGGGRGAFIGSVHRIAAQLDGKISLTSGCFSSDPQKSRLSGEDFGLEPSRVYGTYQEMVKFESARPSSERLDLISIVTRNDTHFAVAKTFLEAGFHVICDKPLCHNLKDAIKLREIVRKTGQVFALTHNYTGYPLVREARHLVRSGLLGKIIKVVVEYPQGYALSALDDAKPSQISNWRMDPAISGASNCMGDIGTHAENLARFVSGLQISEICAELSTFIPGRLLDDDGNCLIRYDNGARGILYASQVSSGEENNLRLRVYGEKGSLEWRQEDPNELYHRSHKAPTRVLRRGNDYLSPAAKSCTRLPFAHPEGFIEAFANVYLSTVEAVRDHAAGKYPRKSGYDFPSIDDGVAGVAFIDTVVKSSKSKAKWTAFPKL